jgi:hypothetical protein
MPSKIKLNTAKLRAKISSFGARPAQVELNPCKLRVVEEKLLFHK